MGLVVVVLLQWTVSSREWYHYVPTAVPGAVGAEGDVFASTARVVRSPITWTASFLLFAFAAVLGGLAFVGSDLVPADPATTGLVMGGLAAVLLVVYLFAGTYYLAKSRGVGDAAATAAGASVIALVLAAVIFARLLLGL